LQSIASYVRTIFGKVGMLENELEAIARYALQDKKNKGGDVLSVLMEEGNARWDQVISLQEIKQALSFYLSH
jgi:3-dehydroquinate synthase